MEEIKFEQIDPLPQPGYPSGSYVMIHWGVIPKSDGIVLSDVKTVFGWPNRILEAAKKDSECPEDWLKFVEEFVSSKYRPDFNMGVYEVSGKSYPVAIYGPSARNAAEMFRDIAFAEVIKQRLPTNKVHFAAMF